MKKIANFGAKICVLYAGICCAAQIVFFTNAKKTTVPNGYFFSTVGYYKNPKMIVRFFTFRPSFDFLYYFMVVNKNGYGYMTNVGVIDVINKEFLEPSYFSVNCFEKKYYSHFLERYVSPETGLRIAVVKTLNEACGAVGNKNVNMDVPDVNATKKGEEE